MTLNNSKLLIAMASKCMTTADLARETGYSLSAIRSYVNKERKPSTKAVGKIAKALGVDVTEIIELED